MATVASTPRFTASTLGSDTAGPFNVGFRLFESDALTVYVNGTKREDWTLTADLDSGYDDAATITFDAALTTGDILWIEGSMVPERETDYGPTEPRQTDKLNAELARVWATLVETVGKAANSLRTTTAQPPVELDDGAVPMFKDGVFQSGPTADEITAAQGYATAAANTFASFDVRYLGAKSSDPATDNNGDPLIEGALYFNSTDDEMKVYNGSSWGTFGDMTDAEVETAYNNRVSQVSSGEKTAGTETNVRRFSPKDVADMAGTHGGGGSGDVTGPGSATDGNFASFDGATGKLIQDSGKSASDFATSAQGTKADNALPKAGGTMTGELVLKETKETVYTLSGTAIDPANGTIQTKTFSANTTFTESLQSGQSVTLHLAAGDSYTITWPTITWVGGAAPTLTADDVIVIWKVSTTLYGAYIGSVA